MTDSNLLQRLLAQQFVTDQVLKSLIFLQPDGGQQVSNVLVEMKKMYQETGAGGFPETLRQAVVEQCDLLLMIDDNSKSAQFTVIDGGRSLNSTP